MFPFADTIPTKRWEIVTFLIVAMNVVSLLWLQGLSPGRQEEVTVRWGFVPARVGQLVDRNKMVEVRVGEQQRLWGRLVLVVPKVFQLPSQPSQILLSVLTCLFLHGGWWHLIGNMWFLLIFGNNIEDRLGHFLYAVFYLLGGVAATAVHWATDPTSATPIIGASGAIAAVLGAYAVTFPHARIKTLVFLFVFVTVIELPAYLYLVLWLGAQLFSGLGALGGQMNGGVAWWAHVGGFVAGAAMMPLFRMIAPPQEPELLDAENEDGRRGDFERRESRWLRDQGPWNV